MLLPELLESLPKKEREELNRQIYPKVKEIFNQLVISTDQIINLNIIEDKKKILDSQYLSPKSLSFNLFSLIRDHPEYFK